MLFDSALNPSPKVEKSSLLRHVQIMKMIDDQKSSSLSSVYCIDDFKPIKVLGCGKMGAVFLAVLRSTNEPFAIKVQQKQIFKSSMSYGKMEREGKILAMLDHPFLPRLVAHFESDKHIFLVTQFCAAGNLNKLRQQQVEKSFSEIAIRFYAAEVVCALKHLHMLGIIHRDLKPENILVGEDGHITLTDFDLSLISPPLKAKAPAVKSTIKKPATNPKPASNSIFASCSGIHSTLVDKEAILFAAPSKSNTKMETKRSYSFVGTEEYVAPEMVLGGGHGPAVDWWAFGILLYELLYDHTPFRGSNKKETFSNIVSKDPQMHGPPSSLKDLISKLLVKDPNTRLGAKGIKKHSFFQGVRWHRLQYITRPPVIPPPFSLEEMQKIYREELVIDEYLIKDDPPNPSAPIHKDNSTKSESSSSSSSNNSRSIEESSSSNKER